MQLRKAERKQAKLRIGLAGPAGSGKTYSALLMASGITSWDKIAVIDTENMSADLYAHLGDYNVIPIGPPFEPEKYLKAIKMCEDAGIEVIIIDSVTHVWKGQGGLLEYQTSLGGRYQDWAKTTPRYQKWLDGILHSKCHIICCTRKKQAYSMENNGGKMKVTKLGLDDEIRDGFEYELTLSLNIDMNHYAEVSKNRTTLYQDGILFKITTDTGKELAEWAQSGRKLTKEEVKDVQESKVESDDFFYQIKNKLKGMGCKDDVECLAKLNELIGTKLTSIDFDTKQAEKVWGKLEKSLEVKGNAKEEKPKKPLKTTKEKVGAATAAFYNDAK